MFHEYAIFTVNRLDMIKGVLGRRRFPLVHHIPCKRHSRSPLRLIYFGSDQYSLIHLQALAERPLSSIPYEIRHVVTANYSTPVAKYCAQIGLSCSTWPREGSTCADALISNITEWQRDSHTPNTLHGRPPTNGILGLVVSFGRFLPVSLISAFGRGCVNIHPSLLPRWRGPCPLLHTLLAGDEISGVTVIQLPTSEHTFDTGPVLYQEAVRLDLSRSLTTTQLGQYLSVYSIKAMFKIIEEAWKGDFRCAVAQPVLADQLGLHPSNAPRPTEPMGHVNWVDHSATDIVRFWHALYDTPVSVATAMTMSASESEACVRFVGHTPRALSGPQLTPPNVDGKDHSSGGIGADDALAEASELISLLPYTFPFGSLVYLRSQRDPNHRLLPFAFVACRPHAAAATDTAAARHVSHTWLAVPSVQIRLSGSRQFRPLTALDMYNGYLRESESRELAQRYRLLPHGFHLFRGFHSLPQCNPLCSQTEYKQPLNNPALLSAVQNSFFKPYHDTAPPSFPDENFRPLVVPQNT